MKRILSLSPLKISFSISIVTIFLYLVGFPFFEMVELKSLDMRFLARGKQKPADEVVIVTIDEKSLDMLGRWPWPRKQVAGLVDALTDYDVNSIGFDIVFAEPDQNTGASAIKKIEQKLDSLNLKNSDLSIYLESLKKETDNDAILAASLKRSGRAVLGYFFHTSREDIEHIETDEEALLNSVKGAAYSSIQYLSQTAKDVPFARENFSIEANLDQFSRVSSSFGYFNIFPDFDGTVRWVPLIMKYKDTYFPPLALQLARHYMGNPNISIVAADYGVDRILLGDIEIPTDEGGNLLINYRGGQKTFPHYSAYDVIEKTIAPEKLKNKIVLLGATAIGIYDMRVTPFAGVFPGVEIHANIIDNILKNNFLFRPDWIALVDLVIILAVGLLLGIGLPKLGPRSGSVAVLLLLGAYLGGNYYAFAAKGLWLTVVYPTFAIIAIYTTITLYHYMSEEKEKRKVKKAFQYYMTSSVVNEVLKDPEKLKLGGDKKNLSVLFSDIRNFTSISERMSPEELVHFLNEYLTVMTDIVFNHDGVLDKYMGDAIMSIYGAPMERPDHPYLACMTALDMMSSLKELHKSWGEQGLPKMDIGIGISTGPMVVGNMGSERRFDYTVMGDTVNLGARLESINKMYGTNIIVSEGTYREVDEKLICRELDTVKVKGKEEPVKIYELLAERGRDERYDRLAETFLTAITLYRGMKWQEAAQAFNDIFKIRPNDPPSKMYIERCKTIYNSPPPPDWDGVFTMTTK